METKHKWVSKDRLSIDVIQNALEYLCKEDKTTIPVQNKIKNYPIVNSGRKIQGIRRVIHCNFCGEKGHIKKTCQKREEFKTQNQKPQNQITYDPTFSKLIQLLDPLKSSQVSIPELLQLRTIIDTLIYFHPTNQN